MRIDKRFIRKTLCTVLSSLAFTCALPIPSAVADQVTVLANAPQVIPAPVQMGDTRKELDLSLKSVNNLRLQVIAPVTGVTLSLLEPSGHVYLPPRDPSVTFLDGSLLSPPLPGGVFITPTIPSPSDGMWKLRLDFPSAAESTVVMATVYTDTPYKVAMVLDSSEYPVGQTISVGMLVLNGSQPVIGQTPSIQIQSPSGFTTTFTGVDNGDQAKLDGMANDGIYSGVYTFNEIGTYTISGQVTIATTSGPVQRNASTTVTIRQPAISSTSVQGVINRGTNNCISSLDVLVGAQASQAATYVASGKLSGSNGKTIEKTTNQVVTAPQGLSFKLSYASQEIRDKISVDSPYTLSQMDLLSFTTDGASLESRQLNALSFPNINLTDLCRSPIEIGGKVTEARNLRAGYIDSLGLSFPVYVATTGNYQITLKVTDQARQDVRQYGFSQNLMAGNNTVTVTMPASLVQAKDGPYSVESVLIVGAGATAQASLVGNSSNLSRWQFYPTIDGDMDGDGDVDATDRDLLLSYRNQTAQIPGDRRDLNHDGKIDIKDIRVITTLSCAQGSCPAN